MSAPNSTVSKNSGGEFPAGLRVLVVDDDPTCLKILEKMLKNCLYQATTCNRAEKALRFLRDNKNGIDVVISDVHMPDMDGFKLLEQVGLEMDLPVIMMSADDSKDVVMKGVTHGACDYLIKPVRIEALKNIWQHVVRKKKHGRKDNDYEQSGSVEDGERQENPQADVDCSSSANEGNWKSSKRRKEDESVPEGEGEGEDKDDNCSMKKPRVVWSPDLHQQFVAAVSQLGIDKAVPKKILELMNVPGLSRENVASHLQKYRLYLRRLGSVSPYGGFDLQPQVTSAQIPSHSLASIQDAAIHKTAARIPVSAPHMEQGNLFTFGGPNLRSDESQQWIRSNSNPTNMLHGIPTNIEPRKFTSLNRSGQSFGSMTMKINSQADQSGSLLVVQPLSRSTLHENGGRQILGLPSSRVHTISSNGICSTGLRQSSPSDGTHGTIYTPVDLSPANSVRELPANKFPHAGTLGTSNLTSEVKGSGGLGTSYEYYNGLKQQKAQDWGLQYVESNFNAPQHPVMQGSIDASRGTLVHPGLPSFQESGQNRIRNASFSSGGGVSNGSDFGLPLNSFILDNSFTNKVESLPDASCSGNSFLQQPCQEDLMSVLLKQQENFGLVENDFGFDGYPLGNLPV